MNTDQAIAFEHESAGVTANCLAPGGATRLHAVTRPMFEQLRADGLITEAEWDSNMDVNAKGVFLMVRAALPALRQSRDASIVNTASIAGKQGYRNMVAYCGSNSVALRAHCSRIS